MGKVESILELVRSTASIDNSNSEEICKMQDILNCNGYEAREAWEEMNQRERRILIWLLGSITDYETFTIWLKRSLLAAAEEKMFENIYSQVIEQELKPQFNELYAKQKELHDKEVSLLKKESELNNRERNFIRKANLEAGQEVRILRRQLREVETRLNEEITKNKQAKLALKVMELDIS